MFCHGRIAAPHFGQRLFGSRDSPRGTRQMTTLRNEPMSNPNAPIAPRSQGSSIARDTTDQPLTFRTETGVTSSVSVPEVDGVPDPPPTVFGSVIGAKVRSGVPEKLRE